MDKLYMMITLAGKLVGTIGPLPYDMDECVQRAADKMATINSDETKRELARREDLVLKCEFHSTRPKLADGADGYSP